MSFSCDALFVQFRFTVIARASCAEAGDGDEEKCGDSWAHAGISGAEVAPAPCDSLTR